MNFETLNTRLEDFIQRFTESHLPDLSVSGSSSGVGVAQLLALSNSPSVQKQPHVVLLADENAAEEFIETLQFFSPEFKAYLLPAFDVSPYSGLYPNPRVLGQRVEWLWHAHRAQGGEVFVASVEALLQKSITPAFLNKHVQTFRIGDELPSQLGKWLSFLGYQSAPRVEDVGQYSLRAGIVDIFSPAHPLPVRIELFGDAVESARLFDPDTQRTEATVSMFTVLPVREVLFDDQTRERGAQNFKQDMDARQIDPADYEPVLHDLVLGRYFPGIDFLLSFFYPELQSPLQHFQMPILLWKIDTVDIERKAEEFRVQTLSESKASREHVINPPPAALFSDYAEIKVSPTSKVVLLSRLQLSEVFADETASPREITYRTQLVSQLVPPSGASNLSTQDLMLAAKEKIDAWKRAGFFIFISTHTKSQGQRLKLLLERQNFLVQEASEELPAAWTSWRDHQTQEDRLLHIIERPLPESAILVEERVVFLRDQDFFGRKIGRALSKSPSKVLESMSDRAKPFQFTDIKPGDYVVHIEHGVALYEGLKVMNVSGFDAEFLQLRYKDNDRLYLPIYRIAQIQKYNGVGIIDKLGGTSWQKTKIRVKGHLKDIASDLLMLYAQRAQMHRPSFSAPDDDYRAFEAFFPYDETDDQLKAIDDVLSDMQSDKPMDRLVCGDVGFGKTEVALRAAFKCFEDGKQVAILAPTTVLTFQHLEIFKKRFAKWPAKIVGLSRFTTKENLTKNIAEISSGTADIAIGTHRLLSKDVNFKNLGLLIIDEEQKFGVTHKEKIKKMKASVDTLTLSATPIPRTLNMSLMGVRDLSVINTAPRDRLPIRTFVSKFDEEIIRKAIMAEVQRGGQVFFVHNRVQGIEELAGELRSIVPDVRIQIGHGQMPEDQLEKVMLSFYRHEYDVLLSTTIIESGLDIPSANTMIIDRADTFGLSQLYQLRGRVGRSKERAYCYLLIPKSGLIDPVAQERLKLIQENSSLGSGFKIANHDLELRGAGNILGESQSGFIDAVGHELYLELLEDALRTARGEEPAHDTVEPDINVRIAALIPDTYIPDIRIRLSYYKILSDVQRPSDLDKIEDELRDQFGAPPEQVMNLMGIMLIRRYCKHLGVRDLTSAPKSISIAFTDRTPLSPLKVVELATRNAKKFSITPDNRLIVRMDAITWPAIYEEMVALVKLAGLDRVLEN